MATLSKVGAVPLPEYEMDWEKNVPYIFGSLVIIIEYLQGDTRTKPSKDGVNIETLMPAAYGEILDTTDIHGEKIDMYLAPTPDRSGMIYVIDQINPATGAFDEHKVMLGFGSYEEAVQTYLDVFGDNSGDKRLAFMTMFTPAAFDGWLKADGATLMPASNYKADGVTKVYDGVAIAPFNKAGDPAKRDAAGGVMIKLPDVTAGPVLQVSGGDKGCFNYHLYFYSALSIVTWSNVIDTLCRAMDLASEDDTFHIHIASPGGAVFLMGRIISAINRTKGKVITYAEGCVASAATAIWSEGHERHILPGSFFMQHMSSQALAGKTTDIASKAAFSKAYIEERLKRLVTIGLFTQEEIDDMADKGADVYISGREAIERMGTVSTKA